MLPILEKKVFPFVDKPARYTGGEVHSIVKDHAGRTTITLIYPDVYEVGISNVGLKILYNILNSRNEFVCERAYAPWTDFEEKIRELQIPLYSLETQTPLAEFDILGFSFQYELLYTNFLNILDLSGIPFRSEDRNENHPLLFGGGPVSCNLEPVAPFLDAICVGDGETRIVKMTEAVREAKAAKLSRFETLKKLSEIDGVYVPSLYTIEEKDGFQIPVGKTVRRTAEPDLNAVPFPGEQILPNIQAVQDRAVVEVARGCTRGCRFCQAGIGYRPVRERSVNKVLDLARNAVGNTGYREFSLISLSISDYSELNILIEALDKQFSPHGVSFSLPSLRLDSFTLELAQKVQEIRKSGLTFAVEGGTQTIRNAINKGVKEDELMSVIRIARSLGWKSVKLYFMIGLPSPEGTDEIQGIAELAEKICREFPGFGVTLSTAVFIPKPHTPFQWEGQMLPEKAHAEFGRLLSLLKKRRNINIRFNNVFLSAIEGIFSRGDRRLSCAIEAAFKKGARFDGWNDRVNFELWKETFRETQIDPEKYLGPRSKSFELPWDKTDCGSTREFLLKELERSRSGELTEDCRESCTNACGCCDFDEIKPRSAGENKLEKFQIEEDFLSRIRLDSQPKFLIRFLYSKTLSQRYSSPVDFEELFSRALVRANLPVVFTRGYNPHIRVEMGWALPIGFESCYEIAEIEAGEEMSPGDWKEKLNLTLPPGIRIERAAVFPLPHAHLSRSGKEHLISFDADLHLPEEAIKKNLEISAEFKKVTSKAEKMLDLRNYIRKLSFENHRLNVTYLQTEGGARLQDILLALTGLNVREAVTLSPRVNRRYVVREDKEIDLMDL